MRRRERGVRSKEEKGEGRGREKGREEGKERNQRRKDNWEEWKVRGRKRGGKEQNNHSSQILVGLEMSSRLQDNSCLSKNQ